MQTSSYLCCSALTGTMILRLSPIASPWGMFPSPAISLLVSTITTVFQIYRRRVGSTSVAGNHGPPQRKSVSSAQPSRFLENQRYHSCVSRHMEISWREACLLPQAWLGDNNKRDRLTQYTAAPFPWTSTPRKHCDRNQGVPCALKIERLPSLSNTKRGCSAASMCANEAHGLENFSHACLPSESSFAIVCAKFVGLMLLAWVISKCRC